MIRRWFDNLLSKRWAFWLSILAIALVARLFVSGTEIKLWVDSQAYLNAAKNLLSGQFADFPPERPPGFPLLLAGIMAVMTWFPVSLTPETVCVILVSLQVLLGLGTIVLTVQIGKQLTLSPGVLWILGVVTSLLPDLLRFERTILTESIYTFLFVALCYASLRWLKNSNWRTGLIAGILAALALSIRSTAIAPLACLVGLCIFAKRWKSLPALVVPSLVVIASMVLFQHQFHGKWLFLAGGGMNQLYKAVDFIQYDSPANAGYKQALRQFVNRYPDYRTFEAVNDAHVIQAMAEEGKRPYWQIYLDHDQTAGQIAREAMLSNPVQTIGVTLREFWHLVVSPTEWDPEARIWSVLFWLGLLGMAVRARQPETRLLMLLTISQLMLYPLLTVCDGRYRIPLEPVFLVFVVVAAYEIGRVASQPEQEITV